MHRFTRGLLAGSIGAAAVMFGAAPVSADDTAEKARAKDAATPLAFPAGIKARDAEDPGDIYKTFTGITEAALTKEGFDDVVERLVDQDRNRIGKFAEQTFEDIDSVVVAIDKQWKEKYGEDFKVEPKDALKSVALIRGEIEDPKAVATNWPVKAVAPAAGDVDAVAAAAAEKAETENARGNADPNINSNVEKGRDVAIATIPASHGLPAINVSLIREAQGWRIDVPNSVTGEQLKNNLARHLSHVKDAADRWPADKNDAAALVAHHVLMAAYNVELPAPQ